MSSFEQTITQAWYRKGFSWVWLLLPLTGLFIAIRILRTFIQQHFLQESVGAPVLVVGNISVGGTGKTPLIIKLCQLACELGYRPGVVSRGYGSKAPYYPYLVTPQSPVEESGDEALLIATATQVPVAIDANRVNAAKTLVAQGCNFIFSDDGLQHYKLARQAEIVVVDAKRLFGNGLQLPAGPLREPLSRLGSVDAVMFNVEPTNVADKLDGYVVKSINMQVEANGFVCLQTDETLECIDTSQDYYAVTGIGNPERFFSSLQMLGIQFTPKVFDDHHPFSVEDFNELSDKPVIMTEKDAVKCSLIAKQVYSHSAWFALKVESQVDAAAEGYLKNLLDKAATQYRTKYSS